MVKRSKNKKSDDRRQLNFIFGDTIPKANPSRSGVDRPPLKPEEVFPDDMDDGFSLSLRYGYAFNRE